MVYPYTGLIFSKKKEQTTNTHSNLDESRMHYAKQRKPYTKGYKLYDSFYMKFKNRQNKVKIRTLISFEEGMGLIRRGTKNQNQDQPLRNISQS